MNRRQKADKKKAKRVERHAQRREETIVIRYPIYAPAGHLLRKGAYRTDNEARRKCERCGEPAVHAVVVKVAPTDGDFHFACGACPDAVIEDLPCGACPDAVIEDLQAVDRQLQAARERPVSARGAPSEE